MVWSISTVSVSGYLKHRAPRVSIRVGWHVFWLSVCWNALLCGSKAALVRKHLHSHGHSSSSNSFISESLSSPAAWSCSQLAVGTLLSLSAVVGAGNAMAVQLPVAEDEDPLADAVPGWGGPVNVGSHNPVRFNTAILSRSEALRLDAFLSSLVFFLFSCFAAALALATAFCAAFISARALAMFVSISILSRGPRRPPAKRSGGAHAAAALPPGVPCAAVVGNGASGPIPAALHEAMWMLPAMPRAAPVFSDHVCFIRARSVCNVACLCSSPCHV